MRPGDVLTHFGGKTVEVLNTDAEGRLVLADALVHGSALKPDAMVDMATLTGAVVVALGDRIGGLMGTDDKLVAALREAGDRVDERFWELPLADDLYGDRLTSDIADLRNIPNVAGQAGTVTAGLFLSRFVDEGIPWAHLDIAGLAWTDRASLSYQTKGGTGAPVRMLIDWLQTL
ncbi:MAG: leucyl aminopeptidase [Glaciecola sp.]